MKNNFHLFWLTALMMLFGQSLSAHDFEVDGIYYNYLSQEDKTVSVTFMGNNSYSKEYSGNVVIPESVTYSGTTYSVTSIGGSAFFVCSGLTSIEIPNSVTSIGRSAFSGCTGLTSIAIPNSVTWIGDGAFSDCTGLTSIAIPNSVTSIGEEAVEGCKGLMSIEIPNSVTSIRRQAFMGCSGLTSIEIPNSVTYIDYGAFNGCSGVTNIEIPSSVTWIGTDAFSLCSRLTSVVVALGNSKYDSSDNCNAIIETASNTLIQGCQNTIIPNNVTSISYSAFWGCAGLTSIEIPSSVTSIKDRAFWGCSNLTSVTVLNPIPATIYDSNTFEDCTNATLYVPKGSKTAYETAPYWKEFKQIVEIGVGDTELYNITVPDFANGSVTSDKSQAAAGEIVTFTAEPNTSYYLRELKVQKHTSGEDAQAPSIRSINVSSAETVAMTYNAVTGSYTGTYTMPACDVTIAQANFVAKTKQSIVAQDVTCTLGDTELTVSATNQTQGGGTLTYAVSEGNDVVRVDAESGALTILKAGTATVTVTAAEMEKYLETAVSVQVTVLNTITAQANDVTLPYDGAAHGIQVNVSAPTTGYTVTYGTEAGHYTLTTSPTQTVVGSLTVYYKVSAAGYTDLEGSAKVTIVKADIAAGNYDTPQSTVVTGDGIVYTGGKQTLVSGGTTNEGTTYYRVNGGAWSNETPSATEPGTYVIEWYVAGDANHNDMGSTAEPAGTLTVTILNVKEVAMVQGLATFYNGASAYCIPDNAKAWTGTVDYANGCVNMREVTGGIIPAGTAVVLTSEDEKVTLVQSLSEASAIESDLHGTDTYRGGALTGDENIYVLHNGEFVWATSGTLASGKAYLVYDPNLAPNHAAAMRLWLNFDEVTSIASLKASAEKSTSYDLQGEQVVAPRPNVLYIRNGKAVLLK